MDRSGILVLLMILSSVSVNGKLPPGIQVCPRNLPNMADCIIKSIRKLQPSLVSGDLGGGFVVPPLEPFKIAKITTGGKNENFNAVFTDLSIRGASKFRIEKIRQSFKNHKKKANMNDLKFDFIVFFPTLEIRGKYDMVFKLYGNDFDGDGKFLSAFENRRARIGMRGRKYLRNGVEYLKFDKFTIKIQPGHIKKIELSNLFQGNKALEEIANAFINANSEFFLEDVYPGVEKSLSEFFTNIANKISDEATFDELFPIY